MSAYEQLKTSWSYLGPDEQHTLTNHFLADGIEDLVCVFEFLPDCFSTACTVKGWEDEETDCSENMLVEHCKYCRHATSNNDLVEVDVSEELLLQASLDLKKSEKEAREEADLEEAAEEEWMTECLRREEAEAGRQMAEYQAARYKDWENWEALDVGPSQGPGALVPLSFGWMGSSVNEVSGSSSRQGLVQPLHGPTSLVTNMGSGASQVQGTRQQSMHGLALESVLQGFYVTWKQGRVDDGVGLTVPGTEVLTLYHSQLLAEDDDDKLQRGDTIPQGPQRESQETKGQLAASGERRRCKIRFAGRRAQLEMTGGNWGRETRLRNWVNDTESDITTIAYSITDLRKSCTPGRSLEQGHAPRLRRTPLMLMMCALCGLSLGAVEAGGAEGRGGGGRRGMSCRPCLERHGPVVGAGGAED
ncbi:unnamed protein product [Symbiodinium sp. KB8]|nr:unnamed protein product [Symbiodinium sp. KB8]